MMEKKDKCSTRICICRVWTDGSMKFIAVNERFETLSIVTKSKERYVEESEFDKRYKHWDGPGEIFDEDPNGISEVTNTSDRIDH